MSFVIVSLKSKNENALRKREVRES